jgi:hypothetical protein
LRFNFLVLYTWLFGFWFGFLNRWVTDHINFTLVILGAAGASNLLPGSWQATPFIPGRDFASHSFSSAMERSPSVLTLGF